MGILRFRGLRITEVATTTITFDRPILGLLTTDAALDATDVELGSPDTVYGVGNRATFDDGTSDRLIISADRRTLDVQLFVGDNVSTDQIRVLTEADPGELNPVLFVEFFDCDNEGFGQFNFADFRNWDVTTGFVDLRGPGFFGGDDQSIDLDGSRLNVPAGKMESKQSFDLDPGLYTLSFQIANVRGVGGDNTVIVELGSVYSESFAFTATVGISHITRVIAVASPESAKLVFDESGDAADGNGVTINDLMLRRGVTATTEPSDFRTPAGDTSTLVRNLDDTFTRRLKDGTELHFDIDGLQITRIDRNGNTTSYSYDAQDRLTTITDPVGLVTTFAYVGDHLSTVTDPASRITQFDHDASGNLIRVTLPDSSTREFDYDAQHLLTDEIDARGLLTRHRYDGLGRLVDVTLADGSVRLASNAQTVGFVDLSTGLGSEANPAPIVRPDAATSAITDAEGRTRTFETAAFGAATAVIDAAGLRTEIERDANGNPTRTERPSGDLFERSFDPLSNLLSSKDVLLNGTTAFTYDPEFSQLTSITDPFSETTAFGQDLSGNLTSIVSPVGRTMTFTRTPAGQVATLTDPLGTLTSFVYDGARNLSELRQGTGLDERLTLFTYTAEGLVDTISDPEARLSDFDYDPMGRITQRVLPDGEVIDFEYDDVGNLTALGPPGRPFHLFEYDNRNRESVYDPPPVSPADPATLFSYDREGLLTEIDRPDGASLVLDYDSAGRLDALTLPRGTVDLQYNALTGVLDRIVDLDGGALDFGYLGSRQISETWSGVVAGSVSVTLDPDGSLATRSVNGTHTAVFDYDADALLIAAGAETLHRDINTGLLTGTTLGSITTGLGYNAFAERSSDVASFGATDFYENSFVRDKLGRIVQKTETIGGITRVLDYGYDAAGRLEEVKADTVITATYAYDANGNRLSATTPSGTTVGSYDDQDRLLSYSTTTYAYTENGELTSKTDTAAAETTLYDTDILGNLRRVDLPDGTVVEYVIDGSNRRLGKKVNGALVQGLLYGDQLNPLAEIDNLGNVVSRFVYGTKRNVPDYMVTGGVVYAIVSDPVGSVRLVVDSTTGAIAQRIDYDEFGNVTNDTSPGFQPFGFAGGLYEPDTGLVRFGARDYDPEVGRWTAKDSIRFAGGDPNLYGYVVNDPVNLIDPSGENPLVDIILNQLGGRLLSGRNKLTVCEFNRETCEQDALSLECGAKEAAEKCQKDFDACSKKSGAQIMSEELGGISSPFGVNAPDIGRGDTPNAVGDFGRGRGKLEP